MIDLAGTHMMLLSQDPEKRLLLSGFRVRLDTISECPSSLLFSTPASRSHTLLLQVTVWTAGAKGVSA